MLRENFLTYKCLYILCGVEARTAIYRVSRGWEEHLLPHLPLSH